MTMSGNGDLVFVFPEPLFCHITEDDILYFQAINPAS